MLKNCPSITARVRPIVRAHIKQLRKLQYKLTVINVLKFRLWPADFTRRIQVDVPALAAAADETCDVGEHGCYLRARDRCSWMDCDGAECVIDSWRSAPSPPPQQQHPGCPTSGDGYSWPPAVAASPSLYAPLVDVQSSEQSQALNWARSADLREGHWPSAYHHTPSRQSVYLHSVYDISSRDYTSWARSRCYYATW